MLLNMDHVTSSACVLLLLSVVVIVEATYIVPWKSAEAAVSSSSNKNNQQRQQQQQQQQQQRQEPENVATKFPGWSTFSDDMEIRRYLKSHGRRLMIWRCRNAIQPNWDGQQPITFIELYCDVIGTVLSVTWYHHGKPIASSFDNTIQTFGRHGEKRRYRQTVTTHYHSGRYYLAWLDFTLRIYNATSRQSGVYRFEVVSPDGDVDRHSIYVDISSEHENNNKIGEKVDVKRQSKKARTKKSHRRRIFDTELATN